MGHRETAALLDARSMNESALHFCLACGAVVVACNTSAPAATVPPAATISSAPQAGTPSPTRGETSLPSTASEAALSAAPAATTAIPTAPSPATAIPAAASAPAQVVVAAIGDSLTDARSGGGGYLAQLQQRCPESRFDNFGVGGEMLNQMRARFDRDVLAPGRPHYSHLIVFGGVNDLYSDLTAGRVPAKITPDLAWMYARAHEHGMRVVAVTVAPWGGFSRYFNPTRAKATLELNAWIEGQAATGAADHVVDAYALLSCGDPERLCPEYARPSRDGLHFGRLGHEALGRAVFDAAFANCL